MMVKTQIERRDLPLGPPAPPPAPPAPTPPAPNDKVT